jgi:hypothetical protein
MPNFDLPPSPIEIPSSREGLIIKKLSQNGININTLSEDQARSELSDKKYKFPGVTPESVVAEMKRMGLLRAPVVKKEEEKNIASEPEMISNFKKLQGIIEVDDEDIKQMLIENKFSEELANNIFKNDKDLDDVYDQAIALEKNYPVEGKDYYEGFVDLVDGGLKEIENDLQSLADRQQLFKSKIDTLPVGETKKSEKMKKIATIVECGIAHAVTNLKWYGDNVSIEPVCQFDDIKRGVDGVLQISEQAEEEEIQNAFLALGVDATYRGLLSQEYKEKFAKLLNSIAKGFKTKIKYFKNHQG